MLRNSLDKNSYETENVTKSHFKVPVLSSSTIFLLKLCKLICIILKNAGNSCFYLLPQYYIIMYYSDTPCV